MNKTDHQKLRSFPALDEAVEKRFPGSKCKSCFSIFEMTHVTNWKKNHKRAKEIKAFVQGFMAGNEELRNRMEAK